MMLHFLMSVLPLLGFAAAAVVPEVTGGGDGVQSETQSDGGHDDAAASGETVQDGEAEQGTGSEGGNNKAGEKSDAGKVTSLPPKVREFMEQLKATDPKALGFMRDVLFRDRAYAKELPGGLAELKTLKETVASLPEGGLQAIKEAQSEWDAIDAAYEAADPKFLDIMVDANPESFNKIAPMVFGKFAQTDPEGYQRHMAGIITATLRSSNIEGALNFASRLITKGDAEGAAQELKSVSEWIQSVDQLAKTQPKTPERNSELDQRERHIKETEDKQWVDGTASQVNTFKTSAIKKELAQYAKGQQIDDETYEAIEGQALKYLNAILMADPNFQKNFNAFCESKDRDGVVRYMTSRLQELLPSKNGKPGPVEKAYKLFFRGATPKPKPAPTPGAVKPGAAPAPPAGWAKIGKAPAPHEIDLGRSPFEMRMGQAAILKNGKKVFWGANAPA